MKNVNEITKIEDLIVALENVKNEEELEAVVENIDTKLKKTYEEELEVILDDFAFDADYKYFFGAKKWNDNSDFEFDKDGYGDYTNLEATLREILENDFEWDDEWNEINYRKREIEEETGIDIDNIEASLCWDKLVPENYKTRIAPDIEQANTGASPYIYDNVVVFGELLDPNGPGNQNLFFSIKVEDEEQAENVVENLGLNEEQKEYLLGLYSEEDEEEDEDEDEEYEEDED